MKIEHQITDELSIYSLNSGGQTFVQYSLHSRLAPQAHIGKLLTKRELEEAIKQQISVLRYISHDRENTMYRLENYIREDFIRSTEVRGTYANR